MSTERTVLITGATGFVGSRLWPALRGLGHRVRCMTRDVARAKREFPEREWVAGDVGDPGALAQALSGANVAYYLVHGMKEGTPDFRHREVLAARHFAFAAAWAGVERIVYLGGMAPSRAASEHLRSRIEVGEVLRSSSVPTLELRASMIVGEGSLSWLVVRDLAARLPFMILPRWLESRTEPIGIADVVVALTRALDFPLTESACFDIPGPEVLSGREILEETALAFGRPRPAVVRVPLLSPWLSSQWVRVVTRANWAVASQIVVGLQTDVLSRDAEYFRRIGHLERQTFREAARAAVLDEVRKSGPSGFWGGVERRLGRARFSERARSV
jgi:uncharacterized protein YbjT (DUF2867 family)